MFKKRIAFLSLLTAALLLPWTQNVLAQGSQLTVRAKDKTLDEIVKLIEAQTDGLTFVYNTQAFQQVKIKDIAIQSGTVEEGLETLRSTAPLDYYRHDQTIALRLKESTTANPTQKQNIVIQGVVRDKATGDGVPGASVLVKNTTLGTVTDFEGNFSITVSSLPATIVVSFIGFEPQTVTIEDEHPIEILLAENTETLEEVIITGQGAEVKKKRLATNVTSISSTDIEDMPSKRIDQLLGTKLPNAQINLTGGQAGATSIIKARGVTSAFKNSTPIIYIDGVRMDNLNTQSAFDGGSTQSAMSAIADIPMDNIDHIEYINGGAATTLYGSDAANGVIQIFTKKGGAAGTHITAQAIVGAETPTTDFLYFNRTKDLLFKTGMYQKYSLSLNGAADNGFGYSFTGSFLNSSGVQIYNQNANKKVNMSSGFTANLGKKVTYQSSFSYVHNQYKHNRNGNQGGYTGLWFAEDGASSITGPGFNNRLDELTSEEFAEMKTYVRNAERLQDNNIAVNRFTTSQTFKYYPVDDLVVKFTGGIDYRNQDNQVIITNEYLTATTTDETTDEGSITNSNRAYLGLTFELNGQYTYNMQDFSFITTLGGQLFRNNDHQVQYVGSDIRDGAKTISDAASTSSDEVLYEVLNYGIYLQENAGYKDKLFLDLGVRADRNPAFGDNIKAQYYPKAGVSWVASSEPWFASGFVSSARLRGSFGVAGNLPTPYANEKTIDFNGFNDQQAAYFGQVGNDDLKPEKTHTLEGGADLGFWHDRISLSVGYYRSLTKDALFYVTPTPSTGVTTSQLYNVGEIENKGWEINTNITALQKRDVSLSFNLSVNTLKNKVLDAGGTAAFNINGFSTRTVQTVVEEGHSIGYLRGNKATFDENGVLASTTAQSYLGTTIPDLFGNIGLNFTYKRFDLFANANYQMGAYAENWDAQFRFYYSASEQFVPEGEIEANDRDNWLNMTNRFIEKTDYLKIRTIGLTYTFQPKQGSAIHGLMVGVTAVNPFNFTASTFDPEATLSGASQGQGSATTGGISYATYSAPRQFLTTIRFKF